MRIVILGVLSLVERILSAVRFLRALESSIWNGKNRLAKFKPGAAVVNFNAEYPDSDSVNGRPSPYSWVFCNVSTDCNRPHMGLAFRNHPFVGTVHRSSEPDFVKRARGGDGLIRVWGKRIRKDVTEYPPSDLFEVDPRKLTGLLSSFGYVVKTRD